MKKLLIAFLVALIVSTSVAVGAVYHFVTNVDLTVTDGAKVMAVYSDTQATTKWLTQDIRLERGQAWIETVYVKNNGSTEITVGLKSQGETGFGLVKFTPSQPFVLIPGEIRPVEVDIFVMPSANVTEYNFSIIAYEP